MSEPTLNRATHLSIVWAVVLAVLTLVEWNSLEREPMNEQIFLPFIERKITLATVAADSAQQPDTSAEILPGAETGRILQTRVQIDFNGPLFLVCFFGPVLIFHSAGLLWSRLRRSN